MKKERMDIQEPVLPKSGSSFPGISDTVQIDCFTGSPGIKISIPVSKARALTPGLELIYSASNGNSIFGMGFQIPAMSVFRKSSDHIPVYDPKADVFTITDIGEVVFLSEKTAGGIYEAHYRPQKETECADIRYFIEDENSYWKMVTHENAVYSYGMYSESRLSAPNKGQDVYMWMLDEVRDACGNSIRFQYDREGANLYLHSIQYGNYYATGFDGRSEERYFFEVVYDYGELDISGEALSRADADPYRARGVRPVRSDCFCSYRSGFAVWTKYLCRNICMFHHLEGKKAPTLVKAVHFSYSDGAPAQLVCIQDSGYRQQEDGSYAVMHMPPTDFSYTPFRPTEAAYCTVGTQGGGKLPGYLQSGGFQMADLYGEGRKGLLYMNDTSVLYYEPMGNGTYQKPVALGAFPIEKRTGFRQPVLASLDGDGELELVVRTRYRSGYYELDGENRWRAYTGFLQYPNEIENPEVEYTDVVGDGLSHMLLCRRNEVWYYKALKKKGYQAAKAVAAQTDFPIKSSSSREYVGFLQMFGDGLEHRVRIRSGCVECWPNLGYGRYGSRMVFENSPVFPEEFSTARLAFGDLDGTGTTDIVYMGKDVMAVYFNHGDGSFRGPMQIPLPQPFTETDMVQCKDLFGTGADAVVFTKAGTVFTHYAWDFVMGKKPYLLCGINNHMGSETVLTYAGSTDFYFEDKENGRPWMHKLPFPVPVVVSMEQRDLISGGKLCKAYRYRDGYYNSRDRVFSGFGYVEEREWEEAADGSSMPASCTKRWFWNGGCRLSGGMYTLDADAYPMPEGRFDHTPDAASYLALAGCLRQQETYDLEGDAAALREILQWNYQVQRLHPPLDGRKGVYRVCSSESMEGNYYHAPNDPAVVHRFALEEDGYGHVTKAADVYYPRRGGDPMTLRVTIAVSDYINETQAYGQTGLYVSGLCYQSRKYEMNGAKPGLVRGRAAYFTLEQLAEQSARAFEDTAAYGQAFDGDAEQMRLYAWERSCFWDDAQENALAPGAAGRRMLLHHKEEAVYPDSYAAEVYGPYFADDASRRAYLKRDAGLGWSDGYWWNTQAVCYYYKEEDQMFYLPYKEEDGFLEQDTCVHSRREAAYDTYGMFPVVYRSWAGEGSVCEIHAQVDYLALAYCRVTDANENVSEAAYDPLGMVMAVSSYGMLEGTHEGGMELCAYKNVRPSDYKDVISNSRTYLQDAMSYYYYDLFRFMERGEPNVTVELKRMDGEHALCAHTFLDGRMREIEHRGKEEEGFCVSKGVVYGGKGQVLKEYPAYYSPDAEYGWNKEEPCSAPVIYEYDGQGQVVKTQQFVHNTAENGKLRRVFAKIYRTPWEEKVYDYNDTIKDSELYQSFMECCPDTPQRGMADQKDALHKAEAFYGTPLTKLFDNCGNVEHEVNYDGSRTTNTYDISGRLSSCQDARLEVCNFRYRLDMPGQPVCVDGADCGRKAHIYNRHGKICASWDGRQTPVRMDYDWQDRVAAVRVQDGDGFLTVEKDVYGDTCGLPEQEVKDKNLNGQVFCYYDGAGVHTSRSFHIGGQPCLVQTQFCQSYQETPDWDGADAPVLEDVIWEERMEYNDCALPTVRVSADGSVTRWRYSVSGKLTDVSVEDRAGRRDVISGMTYHARGMRTRACYGNAAVSEYTYDSATGALVGVRSIRQGTAVFVDSRYVYDPAGNLTRMRDDAQQTVYHGQQKVEPLWDYTYDPYYQLARATGRELTVGDENDLQQMEMYTESYVYDGSGNLIRVKHNAPSFKYTKGLAPCGDSCRIQSITEGGTQTALSYDGNGNLQSLKHVRHMSWNYRNQLTQAVVLKRDGGECDGEYYVYDSSGRRVRKIAKRRISGEITETQEWTTLGCVKYKRVYHNDALILERRMLTVEVDGRAEAVIYDWDRDDRKRETDEPGVEKLHYLFCGLTDSVNVELDEDGAVITREEYAPYGASVVRSGRSQREVALREYRYMGKERDSVTGLYCFGVRYYAPWMCRWASADPAGEIDGMNLYRYAANNPVAYEDKTGMAAAGTGGSGQSAPQRPLVPTQGIVERDVREERTNLRWRIGVLYRADGRGNSHLLDLAAVRRAIPNPNVEIVSLVGNQVVDGMRAQGWRYMLSRSGLVQHNLAGIHAIFVPGGPAAHPAQQGPSRHVERANSSYERARHAYETAVIQQALDRNIPILAVCGGSWRLAGVLGGTIPLLSEDDRRIHNRPMQNVNAEAHDVMVRQNTLLRRVIEGGFGTLDPMPAGDIDLRGVNSVHWASSVFESGMTAVRVSASANAALQSVEAFEKQDRHFVLGIQWHPEFSPRQSQRYNDRILYAFAFAGLEYRAATAIQRVWRRHRARELARQNQAATDIQRVWRGYRVRRELARQNQAATDIQRVWRGYRVRRELAQQNQAAAAI